MLPETTSNTATGNVLEEDTDRHFLAFTAKILDDVDMVQVLHSINLLIKSSHHFSHLVFVIPSGLCTNFNLLDSQKLSRGCVHAEVNTSICSLADQLALKPSEGCLSFRNCVLLDLR